jgi:phosphonate transport system substrate-binding protein
MKEREPHLVDNTRIVFRSEWLGFPPVVALGAVRDLSTTKALATALLGMTSHRLGREILSLLALDGFTTASPDLYERRVGGVRRPGPRAKAVRRRRTTLRYRRAAER